MPVKSPQLENKNILSNLLLCPPLARLGLVKGVLRILQTGVLPHYADKVTALKWDTPPSCLVLLTKMYFCWIHQDIWSFSHGEVNVHMTPKKGPKPATKHAKTHTKHSAFECISMGNKSLKITAICPNQTTEVAPKLFSAWLQMWITTVEMHWFFFLLSIFKLQPLRYKNSHVWIKPNCFQNRLRNYFNNPNQSNEWTFLIRKTHFGHSKTLILFAIHVKIFF